MMMVMVMFIMMNSNRDGQTRVRLFWFAERDKNVFTTMLGLGLLLRLLPGFSSTIALCQYV
jgi:hypothetical protein